MVKWPRALLPATTLASCALALAAPAGAQNVKGFYENKQLRFIVHTAAGGGYDQWSRLVTRHWGRHIPGNPTFIVQNMPGGGGIAAANYIYNQAPRDGTTMGMIGRNLPLKALLGDKAVRYDPAKFGWIGNPEISNYVCAVKAGAPAETAEDLFLKETLFAGAGAGTGTSTIPPLYASLLGLKMKLVEGYPSSTAGLLAIERGEVHGICQSYTSLREQRQGWVENGTFKVLFNSERKTIPGLKAPSIFAYAKTEEQKQLLTLFASTTEFGRPFITPPDVPADRMAALVKSFEDVLKDPELVADATKQQLEISLVRGTELRDLTTEMLKTPPAVVAKMNELVPNP